MNIRTAGTVVRDKHFFDSRQTNRLLGPPEADQNCRPALMVDAADCKVIGCVFDGTGHPCIGSWADAPGISIEDCLAWDYGCIDNTEPGAKNEHDMDRRGAFVYGQSIGHDNIKRIKRCVSYGGFNQSGHCYTQSKVVSGFQFEDGAAWAPGRGQLFIFQSSSPFKNIAFRNYSMFIDNDSKTIASIKCDPDNIFPDGSSSRMELSGNVIVNHAGPCLDIRAIGLTGKDNVFCSRNGHVLAKVQSGSLARDRFELVNTQWFDPEGVGFEINGVRMGWDSWKAKTGDTGSYLKALPSNRVRVFPSPNYPGRSLVIVWTLTPQTSVSVPLQGLFERQQFVVLDVQNIFGPPLVESFYDPSKPFVSIPLPASTAPVNPIRGTVENPWAGKRSTILSSFLIVPIQTPIT